MIGHVDRVTKVTDVGALVPSETPTRPALPGVGSDVAEMDATFCGAASDAVLAAWLGRDRDWLLGAERDLQDVLVAQESEVLSDVSVLQGAARVEAVLELVRGTLRRLAADDATAAVSPGSVAHRILLELRDSAGLANRALAEALGVDETQISRAGRRLEALALAQKRRMGRVNWWELTPRGRQALSQLSAQLSVIDVPSRVDRRNRSVEILRVVQRAFAEVSATSENAGMLSDSLLAEQVALALDLPRSLAEDGVRLLTDSPLVDRRPKSVLSLRHNQPCAVGVSANADGLVGVLVDASARGLGEPVRLPLVDRSVPGVVDSVASLVRRLLDQHGSVEPLGLGVELPGHVDGWRGEVRLSHEFDAAGKPWEDVDLGQLLREATGLSAVVVENDANAVALYERNFGIGQNHRDFSTVLLTERGLGAGIVIDGMLVRGEAAAAGELGHIPMGALGTACRCGRKGCLEKEILDLVSTIAGADDRREVKKLATQAGDLLGRGIAVLLNLLGSGHVIVVGSGTVFEEGTEACRSFRSATRRAVEECGFSSAALVDPGWRYGSREHQARGAAAALVGRYRPSDLQELPESAIGLLDALRRWGTPLATLD